VMDGNFFGLGNLPPSHPACRRHGDKRFSFFAKGQPDDLVVRDSEGCLFVAAL
jgi:hypothetical protein